MFKSPSDTSTSDFNLCLCPSVLYASISLSRFNSPSSHWEEKWDQNSRYHGLFGILLRLEGTGFLHREQIITLPLLHEVG